MKKLVLYGAGGLGRELAFSVEIINYVNPTYELLGFVVDEAYYKEGLIINGYPLLGTRDWLIAHKDEVVCTCAIGMPVPRERIQTELIAAGVTFESIISPDVVIHQTNKIGKGVILARGSCMTVNVTVGDGVFINEGTGIGHDTVIGDYSCVMGGSSICGYCSIGKRVFIGGGVYIVPHIKVGDDAVVASGSVVFTRVKAGTHVLGNPAKRIEL